MPARRHCLAAGLASFVALLAPVAGRAEMARFASVGGYALGGHDAVAYVTRGVAAPGDAAFALQWKGAVWLFESAAAMDAFEMNPSAYAPQYGGYCAFGMSEGRAVPGDPMVFTVIDGRLYLGTDADALRRWSEDVTANAVKADRNWQEMLKK